MLVSRRKSYFISHYNLEVNARNKLQQLIIQKANDELILKEIFEGANVYSRTKGKFDLYSIVMVIQFIDILSNSKAYLEKKNVQLIKICLNISCQSFLSTKHF